MDEILGVHPAQRKMNNKKWFCFLIIFWFWFLTQQDYWTKAVVHANIWILLVSGSWMYTKFSRQLWVLVLPFILSETKTLLQHCIIPGLTISPLCLSSHHFGTEMTDALHPARHSIHCGDLKSRPIYTKIHTWNCLQPWTKSLQQRNVTCLIQDTSVKRSYEPVMITFPSSLFLWLKHLLNRNSRIHLGIFLDICTQY